MPSLTPLHFIRRISISDDDGVRDDVAYYGLRRYVTDCGRFMIIADTEGNRLWCVREYRSTAASSRAIRASGIIRDGFETRQAALGALQAICDDAGLLT